MNDAPGLTLAYFTTRSNEPRHEKRTFCICENKEADQLISAFVLATQIVHAQGNRLFPSRRLFDIGGKQSKHGKSGSVFIHFIRLYYFLGIKNKQTGLFFTD